MTEQFLGEIRIFSFNFAPRDWAMCNGQLLPIAQNQALFGLLGTRYGGDGTTTFALPNLRDRVPIHFSPNIPMGQAGGEAAHTLTQAELPAHTHLLQATSDDATSAQPNGSVLAKSGPSQYRGAGTLTPLRADAVTNVGGNQPHNNMQPFLTLNFCIAVLGFPPQS